MEIWKEVEIGELKHFFQVYTQCEFQLRQLN